MRRLIGLLAVHTVSQPGPSRDYFQRRTAAGKHQLDTRVALGGKLLTTTSAVLTTGRCRFPP